MSSDNDNDFRGDLKIILIGNSGTGKTSYIEKLIKNTFSDYYHTTIISKFYFKLFEKDGYSYRIQIFDLSGFQKNINSLYIFGNNIHGCIIFSESRNIVTREDTLIWKKKLDEISSFLDDGEIPCILVETKSDCLDGDEEEDAAEKDLKEFAQENGFDGQFLCSSKTGKNINESMEYLLNIIINRMEKIEKTNKKVFTTENKLVRVGGENCKNNEKKISKISRKLPFILENYIHFEVMNDGNLKMSLKKIEDEKIVYYFGYVNLDNLKEKYKITRPILDVQGLKNVLDYLLSKNKIIIKNYYPKVGIQIGVLFYTLDGKLSEVKLYLYAFNMDNEKLSKELIKEIIKKKKAKLNKKKQISE